jgi:Protein of unknown function (DUF2637)
MSDQLTPPTGGLGALRIVAVVAACVGVVALVAGAFVFSYPGLHAVALQARVSPRLAKGYPLMLDALLVVAMPAALTLRSAGWSSRLLAWIVLLALLCAAAGADALHAAGGHLKARPAAITAAILPWALVLIAFILLLTMLQHSRARRHSAERASSPVTVLEPTERSGYAQNSAQSLVPGFPAPAALPAAETTQDEDAGPMADQAERTPSDDHVYLVEAATLRENVDTAQPLDEATGTNDSLASVAPPDDDDPEMPVFHRAWSAPMPPGDTAQ